MNVTVKYPEGDITYQNIDYIYNKKDFEEQPDPERGRTLILPDTGWLAILVDNSE